MDDPESSLKESRFGAMTISVLKSPGSFVTLVEMAFGCRCWDCSSSFATGPPMPSAALSLLWSSFHYGIQGLHGEHTQTKPWHTAFRTHHLLFGKARVFFFLTSSVCLFPTMTCSLKPPFVEESASQPCAASIWTMMLYWLKLVFPVVKVLHALNLSRS